MVFEKISPLSSIIYKPIFARNQIFLLKILNIYLECVYYLKISLKFKGNIL